MGRLDLPDKPRDEDVTDWQATLAAGRAEERCDHIIQSRPLPERLLRALAHATPGKRFRPQPLREYR